MASTNEPKVDERTEDHLLIMSSSSPAPPHGQQQQLQQLSLPHLDTAKSIPFAEPGWYYGEPTPYYQPRHARFRDKVRAFVDTHIAPHVTQWDEQGHYPRELHLKAYQAGILGAPFPPQYGGTPPPQGYDPFMNVVLVDELSRGAGGGLMAALFVSMGIALPPILSVGSERMKQTVAREVITGQKIIALAVTEPEVGSDVANLVTTATRAAGGDYYIVNGAKKFITSGMRADYFTTAVRTGQKGMWGISLLLIDAKSPGITRRKLKTQGWWTSNTAHILFEDVRVPASNLIGVENQGFLPIMLNFNNERLLGAIGCCRASRICIQDAAKYARLRTTFGRPLIAHQVIRHKFADMIRRTEALQAWIDHVVFLLAQSDDTREHGGVDITDSSATRRGEETAYAKGVVDAGRKGAMCALVKVTATQTMEFCAREASQIFGGASYLRTGPGARVERIYREVRVNAIGGGSEEILLDLGVRLSKL